MNSYWLDSDVLVFAKDNIAPFGVKALSGFWNLIESNVDAGVIKITKRNYREITEGREREDELAKWLKLRKGDHVCVAPNKDVQLFAGRIGDFVYSNSRYSARYRAEFSKGADAWLIAQAAVDHGTVVTREVPEPQSQKPKIPDVCKQFDVPWISLTNLMRTLGT